MLRVIPQQVDLNIRGADTELDKSLLDKLNDPLLHIVRNARPRFEPADVRRYGQTGPGTLSLNAYHDSGCNSRSVTMAVAWTHRRSVAKPSSAA